MNSQQSTVPNCRNTGWWCKDWASTNQVLFHQSVQNAYENGDIGLLPRGGVAYQRSSSKQVKPKSRLFCFLPLPVPTGLPVHVNGHFALDTESRRNLWRDDGSGYRTDWNKCLMEHVIGPAYCTLIEQLKSSCTSSDDLRNYYSVFPTVTDRKDDLANLYIESMSTSVYRRLAERNSPVLSLYCKDKAQLRWLCPLKQNNREGFFDDLNAQIKESSLHSSRRKGEASNCQRSSYRQRIHPLQRSNYYLHKFP
jgi:hypothetical protein